MLLAANDPVYYGNSEGRGKTWAGAVCPVFSSFPFCLRTVIEVDSAVSVSEAVVFVVVYLPLVH